MPCAPATVRRKIQISRGRRMSAYLSQFLAIVQTEVAKSSCLSAQKLLIAPHEIVKTFFCFLENPRFLAAREHFQPHPISMSRDPAACGK
jgi:hypothetical protein